MSNCFQNIQKPLIFFKDLKLKYNWHIFFKKTEPAQVILVELGSYCIKGIGNRCIIVAKNNSKLQ